LDCAHNNAGISGGLSARTAEYPEDVWHQVIAMNLTGVWLCMKYEIPQMLHQGGGTIVHTASVAGLGGYHGASAYVASKHGVVGLTKTAALEDAPQGIRVNCVCPGYIATPMTAPGMHDPTRLARLIAREPIGRVGTPEEVAEAVVWLCSDAKRLGELLVLEHTILNREDATHVEMFDACEGGFHVIGLDGDDEDIGVVHLLRVCNHADRNRKVHQAGNSRPMFLQVRGALTTSDQRHVFPSSC
jgi:short-subunit dehydrogenase